MVRGLASCAGTWFPEEIMPHQGIQTQVPIISEHTLCIMIPGPSKSLLQNSLQYLLNICSPVGQIPRSHPDLKGNNICVVKPRCWSVAKYECVSEGRFLYWESRGMRVMGLRSLILRPCVALIFFNLTSQIRFLFLFYFLIFFSQPYYRGLTKAQRGSVVYPKPQNS